MNMRKRFIMILVYLAISTSSQGHEFLTQMLVYPEDTIKVSPNSTYHVIKTFNLSEQDLLGGLQKDLVKQEIKRIAAKKHHNVNPEHVICDDWDGVFKTCGVFDHFNEARSMAIDKCAGVAVNYLELYPDGLIPQFIGPSTFIEGGSAALGHHDLYDFSHGLTFNCVEVISNLETE